MKIKTAKIELNRKELMLLINLINDNLDSISNDREKISISDISSKLCRGIHDLSVQLIEHKVGENNGEET